MSAIRPYNPLMIFVGLTFLAGCALQQDVNRLENHIVALSRQNERYARQVAELERQSQELERKSDRTAALQSEGARISDQVQELKKKQAAREEELREQLATLRADNYKLREAFQDLMGKTEMADHAVKQETKTTEDLMREWRNRLEELERRTESNRDRIARFEAYLSLESPTKAGPEPSRDTQNKQTLSEDELYAASKKAFDEKDFDKAREGFQKLIEMYPKSPHADNAQFWIGEIYYREKWYEKSILEYQKVIEKYPRGNKVPASLLKQGLAFSNIDDKANARLILQELVKKFPKSNEATIARQKLKGL